MCVYNEITKSKKKKFRVCMLTKRKKKKTVDLVFSWEKKMPKKSKSKPKSKSRSKDGTSKGGARTSMIKKKTSLRGDTKRYRSSTSKKKYKQNKKKLMPHVFVLWNML